MNYETAANKAEAQILKWGKGARCNIERMGPVRQPNGSYTQGYVAVASNVPVVDVGMRWVVAEGGALTRRRTWLLSGKAIDAAGIEVKPNDQLAYGVKRYNIRGDGLNVTKPDPAGPTILVEVGTLT